MRDGSSAMVPPPARNPQRLHAVGEFGADGDVLGAGLLAGSAAHALVGALVAVLGTRVLGHLCAPLAP